MPDIASALQSARLLAEQFGSRPITRSEAHEVVSPRALRTAVSRGTVVRLHRGVYVVAHPEDDLGRYRRRIGAVLRARPTALASHESALALHGLSLPGFGDRWDRHPVCVIADRGERRRTPTLRVSRRFVPPTHRATTPWGSATTLIRTAVDMARELPFALALVVADEAGARTLLKQRGQASAARRRSELVEMSDHARHLLLRAAEAAPWRAGSANVRRVAEWVDPASESPGESFSRGHLVAAGLPRPHVALRVVGDDGRTYYADLAWPELGVLGEVDGHGKYRDDSWATFLREKRREDSLRAAGWTVVRWTVADVLRDPGRVVGRVRRALDTSGFRSVPRRDPGRSRRQP